MPIDICHSVVACREQVASVYTCASLTPTQGHLPFLPRCRGREATMHGPQTQFSTPASRVWHDQADKRGWSTIIVCIFQFHLKVMNNPLSCLHYTQINFWTQQIPWECIFMQYGSRFGRGSVRLGPKCNVENKHTWDLKLILPPTEKLEVVWRNVEKRDFN